MAENKKSFILYSDLIATVSKMPHEKAGELFLTILEYVNDLDPKPEDLLIQIAFEPIKQQLKRDLKRWEEFKIKQSENGKKGGRPLKSATYEESQKNPEKGLGFLDNPEKANESQKSLNVTVNVNDTVINSTPNGVGNSGELPLPNLKDVYKKVEKSKLGIFNFIKNEKPTFIEPFADFWNLFAEEHNLPKVVKINESRKRKFNVRIRDPIFNIPEIIRKAKTSQFILTANWFTFDWLIENETNFLKVLEGNYDSKQKADEQPENKLHAIIKAAAGN